MQSLKLHLYTKTVSKKSAHSTESEFSIPTNIHDYPDDAIKAFEFCYMIITLYGSAYGVTYNDFSLDKKFTTSLKVFISQNMKGIPQDLKQLAVPKYIAESLTNPQSKRSMNSSPILFSLKNNKMLSAAKRSELAQGKLRQSNDSSLRKLKPIHHQSQSLNIGEMSQQYEQNPYFSR